MEDHAARACLASLDMLERLEELNEKWKTSTDYPELTELAREKGRWVPIHSRIGLNTGICAIGHLGTQERGNYTMMGDNVNLAARLEGTCKLYDISLCVGESTWEKVQDQVEGREIDLVKVMGKTVPTRIYEVVGKVGSLDGKRREFLGAYTHALEAYKNRDFEEARKRFQAALELESWDWVSQIYVDRCTSYIEEPPPEDWDGVTEMKSK
jgi:adenylate cyclase